MCEYQLFICKFLRIYTLTLIITETNASDYTPKVLPTIDQWYYNQFTFLKFKITFITVSYEKKGTNCNFYKIYRYIYISKI